MYGRRLSQKKKFEALTDPGIPDEERAPTRIRDEAFSLLNAGTVTTAGVLRAIFFHLLRKDQMVKLCNELGPSPSASLTEVEAIPYIVMISLSSLFVHMNPELFPHTHCFSPERSIRAQENGDRLESMLVTFSNGPRQCLVINLATAELYLFVATRVRKFDMDLYKTTLEDIETYRDYQVGFPKEKSPGFKATVTRDLTA
ncbi:Cytochrome P450 [Penicillium odoratum]|uniref:Cytochrome P450 n=1 Tax=Penicillium odoratum TaxID=1167516 RepID=UPI002548065D|nr:Cytochrome P450 [Penicillium odoratum]KAJ5758372.1 Cytochrome P450 [Penicillium odoratum]